MILKFVNRPTNEEFETMIEAVKKEQEYNKNRNTIEHNILAVSIMPLVISMVFFIHSMLQNSYPYILLCCSGILLSLILLCFAPYPKLTTAILKKAGYEKPDIDNPRKLDDICMAEEFILALKPYLDTSKYEFLHVSFDDSPNNRFITVEIDFGDLETSEIKTCRGHLMLNSLKYHKNNDDYFYYDVLNQTLSIPYSKVKVFRRNIEE